MHLLRGSLVFSFVVALVGAVAVTTSTACNNCPNSAILKTDCSNAFGTFDEEECTCVGARPYQPTPYPTAPKPSPEAGADADADAGGDAGTDAEADGG